MNIIAFILIFLFVPETKRKTLEELDGVFGTPVRTFMNYQISKVLPYWWKRYIFFQKQVHLEPLYQEENLARS
ncbi:hypothetical protein MMC30_002269 [Trapelia coarctata]|nr:hypothetical protein [Trapelia coarctata]